MIILRGVYREMLMNIFINYIEGPPYASNLTQIIKK